VLKFLKEFSLAVLLGVGKESQLDDEEVRAARLD
jgi:hypothetical protein